MRFSQLLLMEGKKLRRARLLPLLLIAPLLVVSTGVANLSRYLNPDYTNAWAAMFIQSALVYAYYLLPLSLLVVCAALEGLETGHKGLTKMLTLPVSPAALSLAKFCVLLLFLLLELAVFLAAFALAGAVAVRSAGVTESLPLLYLLRCCAGLFGTMLPCLAGMWAVTVCLERTLFSVGLNLLLVIPGVLAAATPLWFLYPPCYSGYLVSRSLHAFTAAGNIEPFPLFPFLPAAAVLFLLPLAASLVRYGKKAA